MSHGFGSRFSIQYLTFLLLLSSIGWVLQLYSSVTALWGEIVCLRNEFLQTYLHVEKRKFRNKISNDFLIHRIWFKPTYRCYCSIVVEQLTDLSAAEQRDDKGNVFYEKIDGVGLAPYSPKFHSTGIISGEMNHHVTSESHLFYFQLISFVCVCLGEGRMEGRFYSPWYNYYQNLFHNPFVGPTNINISWLCFRVWTILRGYYARRCSTWPYDI